VAPCIVPLFIGVLLYRFHRRWGALLFQDFLGRASERGGWALPSGHSLVSWLCCPGGCFFRSGRFLHCFLVGLWFWRPRPQTQGQCLCCINNQCGLRDLTRLGKKGMVVPTIIPLLADPSTNAQKIVVLEAHVQRVAFNMMGLRFSAQSGYYNHYCSMEITDARNISTSPSCSSRHERPPNLVREVAPPHGIPSKFQTSCSGHRQCAHRSREADVCISEPQANVRCGRIAALIGLESPRWDGQPSAAIEFPNSKFVPAALRGRPLGTHVLRGPAEIPFR
jgi:hypothetical protein